jgi:hypothetical protein
VKKNIASCQKKLTRWQRVNKDPTDGLIAKKTSEIQQLQEQEGVLHQTAIRVLQGEVNELLKQDDMKWRQRAKEHWLKMGDRNSKFFHACASQRRQASLIMNIWDEEGNNFTTPNEIEEAFVNYFQKLFTSSTPIGVDNCLQKLTGRVTQEMNLKLLQEFTRDEVQSALHQMGPLKSPGPDGLSACFYQENWDIVGEEVCDAVLNFFNSGYLDEIVNVTHIVLIPKKNNPSKVTDFRPISLCNVIYKIVSKVLANRLKLILPAVISQNQSAFIPGCLILDNTLAAYETLHTMHSRMWGKMGYMAIKLDMSKAYDRVEWCFLEKVMIKMGFEWRWVNLIMTCISSVRYAIIVNGSPVGDIRPTRGIRQGDPLSPYLFLQSAEVLSSQFNHAASEGRLIGVPTSLRSPRINHLFFTDDSLLFCRATETD